jgi:hypothetical protein
MAPKEKALKSSDDLTTAALDAALERQLRSARARLPIVPLWAMTLAAGALAALLALK